MQEVQWVKFLEATTIVEAKERDFRIAMSSRDDTVNLFWKAL